jgi:hypothetical protein
VTTPRRTPPLTRSQAGRLGWQARRATSTPEERSRCARMGAVATARSMAPRRAALAARAHAAAEEASAAIQAAVARGERLRFNDYAAARSLPPNRLRAAFVAAHGMTWREVHRRTT